MAVPDDSRRWARTPFLSAGLLAEGRRKFELLSDGRNLRRGQSWSSPPPLPLARPHPFPPVAACARVPLTSGKSSGPPPPSASEPTTAALTARTASAARGTTAVSAPTLPPAAVGHTLPQTGRTHVFDITTGNSTPVSSPMSIASWPSPQQNPATSDAVDSPSPSRTLAAQCAMLAMGVTSPHLDGINRIGARVRGTQAYEAPQVGYLAVADGDVFEITHPERGGYLGGKKLATGESGWLPFTVVRQLLTTPQVTVLATSVPLLTPEHDAPAPESLPEPAEERAVMAAVMEERDVLAPAGDLPVVREQQEAARGQAQSLNWAKYFEPSTERVWWCKVGEQEDEVLDLFLEDTPGAWERFLMPGDITRCGWRNTDTNEWFVKPEPPAVSNEPREVARGQAQSRNWQKYTEPSTERIWWCKVGERDDEVLDLFFEDTPGAWDRNQMPTDITKWWWWNRDTEEWFVEPERPATSNV